MSQHLSSLFLFVVAFTTMAAQGTYNAPRNAFGQPDLEGVWNFSSDVPLERPKAFADREFFTPEELMKQNAGREQSLEGIAKAAPVEIFDRTWLDYRARVENLRTSLIVYPANGRLPAFADGVQRVGGLAAVLTEVKGGTRPVRFLFGGIGRDAPEDRGLNERCLASGNTTPPLNPGFDDNYLEIVQGPDHVVLRLDGLSGTRIVPLDGRPHIPDALRSWSGSSRGRWDGETLVVETRSMNGRTQSFSDAGTSYDKVVTERFTRVSEITIAYEATIVDPKTFTDRIVLAFPIGRVRTHVYESACHEGNYSMRNMLSGARTEEQDAK